MKFKVGDIVKQINWYYTQPSIISGKVIGNKDDGIWYVIWDIDNKIDVINEKYIELVSDSYKEFREKINVQRRNKMFSDITEEISKEYGHKMFRFGIIIGLIIGSIVGELSIYLIGVLIIYLIIK